MVIAQTHVQAVATVHYSYAYYVDIGPLSRYTMWKRVRSVGTVWTLVRSVGTLWTYVCTVTTVRTDFAGS